MFKLPPHAIPAQNLSGWGSDPEEKRWQNFCEVRHPLADV